MNFGTIILTPSMEIEQKQKDKNDKKPLPIGKNKKEPGLFKDELGEKSITEVVALRPKLYAYLMNDGTDHNKAKGTKKCAIKQKRMFENYKDCLFNNKLFNKLYNKLYIDHRKDLKAIIMMCTQKK